MTTLEENFSKSWKFMLGLFNNVGRLLILIILNIIPVANLIVIGYGAKIIKLGDAIEEPPEIESYGEAFIEGLKVLFAIIIYSIIPGIIAGFSIGVGLLTNPSAWMQGAFFPSIFFRATVALGLTVAFLVGFLFAVFGAMGILHMIKTGDFGKIFAFSEILELIDKVGWGKYLIWLLMMFVINSVITGIASGNWLVSSILWVFFTVFVSRSAHYLYPKEEAEPDTVVESTG